MTDETNAPAASPALPIAAPCFAPGGRPRHKIVPLEWPVDFDGVTYSAITVRRMTSADVEAFFAASKTSSAWLPMFDCPREVIDALDADDAMAVRETVSDFLPRALRTAGE